MGQIIAIVSQKGGVGKTSTAVNLGACISAINRKVLLIGLDPQCGLAKSFGLESEDTPTGLLDVVRDGATPQEAIYAANPRLPHLSLIPSNVRSVADEAFYYGILQRDVTMFGRVLEQLRPAYDFIFLGLSPQDGQSYLCRSDGSRLVLGSDPMRIRFHGDSGPSFEGRAGNQEAAQYQTSNFWLSLDNG